MSRENKANAAWVEARMASDTAPIDGPSFTRGNAKLGKNIFTWNRPFALTCPDTCALLKVPLQSGTPSCYADPDQRGFRMERQYVAALRRLPYAPNLMALPLDAIWRAHVVGDFVAPHVPAMAGSQFFGEQLLAGNRIDLPYIRAIVKQLRERDDINAFGYTHAWRAMTYCGAEQFDLCRELRDLMTIHASVSTIAEATHARDVGWTVALTGSEVPQLPKAKGAGLALLGPRSVDIGDGKIPICPEQLNRVQDCESCGLCIYGRLKHGVAFIQH